MSIKLYDAEVEYLEGTGTQYINLGTTLNSSTDVVDLEICMTQELAGAYKVFGARSGASEKNFSLITSNPNSICIDLQDATYSTYRVTYTYEVGVYYTIHMERTLRRASSNGVTIAEKTIESQSFTTAGDAYLFSFNQAGNNWLLAPCRIKSFTWKRNNLNFINLIPVRVGNVGYMYDKVSGQLFGNSGTGSFVLGPDVAPGRYANEIAFLESTGSQWINTGITNITETDTFSITAAKTSTELAMAFGWNTTLYYNLNLHHASQQKIELAWGAAGTVVRTDLNEINTFHTYSTAIENGNVNFYVDGVNKGYIEASSDDSGQTIYMFARQSNGEATLISPMKIKRFMYFRNNTLLRDFIPVEYNNIGYMYDKVSGEFFANQGTGKFVLGHRAPRFDGKACARSYTRRQLMMEMGRPYDAEIEYLQSNAASGFNIVTNNEFPVQCTFELKYKIDNILGIYDYQTFFSRVTTPFRTPSVYMAGRNSGYYYQTPDTSGNSKTLLKQSSRNTDIHTLVVNFENRTISLDGTQSGFSQSFTMYTVPSKMCLFSAIDSSRKGLYGKIYYFKISKNNQVLLDLIPVRKGNVGMMYDKVTGAVYKNTSTGTFIVGPDI